MSMIAGRRMWRTSRRFLSPLGKILPEVKEGTDFFVDAPDVMHNDTQVLHYFPAHDGVADYEAEAATPINIGGVPFHFFVATPWIPESALALDRLIDTLHPQAIMVDEEHHPVLFAAAYHAKSSSAPVYDPSALTAPQVARLNDLMQWLGPAVPYFAVHEFLLATSYLPFHTFARAIARAVRADVPYFLTRSAAQCTVLKQVQRSPVVPGSGGRLMVEPDWGARHDAAVRAALVAHYTSSGQDYLVEAAAGTAKSCAMRALGYIVAGVAGASTTSLRVQATGGGWRKAKGSSEADDSVADTDSHPSTSSASASSASSPSPASGSATTPAPSNASSASSASHSSSSAHALSSSSTPSTLSPTSSETPGGPGTSTPPSSSSSSSSSPSFADASSNSPTSSSICSAADDATPDDLLSPAATATIASDSEAREIDAAHHAAAVVDPLQTVDGEDLRVVAEEAFTRHYTRWLLEAALSPAGREEVLAHAAAAAGDEAGRAMLQAVEEISVGGVVDRLAVFVKDGLRPLRRHRLGGREWMGTRVSPTSDPPPALAARFADSPEAVRFRKDRDLAARLMGMGGEAAAGGAELWKPKAGKPVLVVMTPTNVGMVKGRALSVAV